MKLLLVDDHPLFCLGFAQALALSARDHEVFTAPSLDDGLALARSHASLDLVLVDYRLADGDGVEGLRRFGAAFPWLSRVLISGESNPALVDRARAAGASGFLGKALPIDAITHALDRIAAGETVFLAAADAMAGSSPWTMPTLRQLEVLELLARGHPNKKIAVELGIAERTVKLHVSALLENLGARSRTHLMVLARERGLI